MLCLARHRISAIQQLKSYISHNYSSVISCNNRSFSTETSEKSNFVGENLLNKLGWLPHQLTVDRDHSHRGRFMLASFCNHLALGSAFTFSMWVPALTSLEGIVVPSSGDWLLGDVTPAFSLVMGGFVWGAITGGLQQQIGARASCLIGAFGLTSGFALTALAASTHNLNLLYAAGIVTGLGNGFAYVPPVSCLMQWFPDRKGLASGTAIAGYGCSTIVTSMVGYNLLNYYKVAPTYVGKVEDLTLTSEGGKLFYDQSEVVVATAKDIAEWASFGLQEGAYLVGTGSTGITETLLTIGCAYGSIMTLAALQYRYPSAMKEMKENEKNEKNDEEVAVAKECENSTTSPARAVTTFNVDTSVATRTNQFWLMYSGFGLAATGAYGFIGAGKTMVGECFGPVITPEFSAAFVAALGVGNLGGRIGWTLGSDYFATLKNGVPFIRAPGEDPFLGRKMAFTLMFTVPLILYPTAYWCVHQEPSQFTLYLFTGTVLGVLSSFGGMAATRPALCADGLKNGPGVLSARQLSVVLPSSAAGPAIVSYIRGKSTNEAIHDLTSKCTDEAFESTFMASKDHLDELMEAKTVTINRLLEICPTDTVDPTPYLYDDMFIIMATLGAGALLTNYMLFPVDRSLHESNSGEKLDKD
jgi:MFS family permease